MNTDDTDDMNSYKQIETEHILASEAPLPHSRHIHTAGTFKRKFSQGVGIVNYATQILGLVTSAVQSMGTASVLSESHLMDAKTIVLPIVIFKHARNGNEE